MRKPVRGTLERLWRARRSEDLLRTSERALRAEPNDPVARLYRGAALLFAGRAGEALPDLHAAFRRAPGAADRIRAGRSMAQAEILLGRPAAAERRLGALARLARTADDRRRVRADRAVALRHLGRDAEARRSLEGLLKEYRRGRDSNNAATVEMSLGNIDLEEGRYAEAFGRFERASAGFRKGSNPAGVARAWHNRGMAFLSLHLLPEATSAFRRAADLAGRLGLAGDEARACYGLALASLVGGDTAAAAKGLERARAGASEDAAVRTAASVTLADLHVARGRPTAALRVLGGLRPPAGSLDEACVLLGRAAASAADGRAGAARRLLSAVRRHPQAARAEVRFEAARLEARLAARARRSAAALSAYAEMLSALEALLSTAGSPEARVLAAARREDAVAEAVRCAFDAGRSGAAIEFLDRAERLKALALEAPPPSGPLAAAVRRARARLAAAFRLAAPAAATGRPGLRLVGLATVRETEERLTRLRLAGSFTGPRFAGPRLAGTQLGAPAVDPIRRMVRACRAGNTDVMLRFFMDQGGLAAVAATPAGSIVRPNLASTPRVRALVRRVQEELTIAEAQDPATLVAHPGRHLRDALHDLYGAVLRPLEKALGHPGHPGHHEDRWEVVPYGDLHGIHLGMLHSGDRYVAERSVVSYRSTGRPLTEPGTPWRPMRRRATIVVGAQSGLAHVDEEVRGIEEALRGWDLRVLYGAETSRRTIAQAFKECEIVHFAGHGVLRADSPMYSYLLLGPREPIYLQDLMTEFQRTNLRPLVVLAACESGAAAGPSGALMSIAQGFLARGAATAIVSDRRVDDSSTALLMKDFYGSLASGFDPARALGAAQYESIKDPMRAHPVFWGSWRAVTQ